MILTGPPLSDPFDSWHAGPMPQWDTPTTGRVERCACPPLTVSATIDLGWGSPADVVTRIAVALDDEIDIRSEAMTIDDQPLRIDRQPDGSALTQIGTTGTASQLRYEATVELRPRRAPVTLTLADRLEFTTPSRYCPSDEMAGLAGSLFGAVSGLEAIDKVTDWVHHHVGYQIGSSQATTTALETLATASGVCRDFAHLTICLLRGLGVPARYVAVYAPGLIPPDFHALVEAHDGQQWRLIDATRLTDTDHAIRIATGRDGADAPFLVVLSGTAPVLQVQVSITESR